MEKTVATGRWCRTAPKDDHSKSRSVPPSLPWGQPPGSGQPEAPWTGPDCTDTQQCRAHPACTQGVCSGQGYSKAQVRPIVNSPQSQGQHVAEQQRGDEEQQQL